MVDSYHEDNKRRSQHPSKIAQHPHQVGDERRIGMKRIVCLLVLVSLVALGNFNRASAHGGPVQFGPFHDEATEVIADCGSFQVLDHYVAERLIIRFFYDTGIRERDIRQFSGADTYINSVTGKSYTATFHNTTFIDFDTSGNRIELANSGVGFRLTLPGGGVVFSDIGRFEVDAQGNVIWQAGPHHFLDGDFAGLCAAMA
jgi:hypothetical protein